MYGADRTAAVQWGLFLLDREPGDPVVGLPEGDVVATDSTVCLVDRDGGSYLGTMVALGDRNKINLMARCAYESGILPNGQDVPDHGLVILWLTVRHRVGSPMRFSEQ